MAYRDEIIDRLKKETGVTSPTDSFKQVQLGYYAKTTPPAPSGSMGPGEVAVVYAEGEIVDGEGDQTEIGGAKFAREIRRLREDASVKAIVLRVNSPGGSAAAAETIQRELRLARKAKPVIVSMGSYAASGGYWISAFGDRIFAEPTTITGSIGVFGIQFDVQKLANDHGVTFDSVKTGKFADALTITRPKTDEELAVFQKHGRLDLRPVRREGGRGPQAAGQPRRGDRPGPGLVRHRREEDRAGRRDRRPRRRDQVRRQAGPSLGAHFRVTEYPRSRNLSEAIAEMLGKIAPAGLHLHSTGLVGEITGRIESRVRLAALAQRPAGRLRQDAGRPRDPLIRNPTQPMAHRILSDCPATAIPAGDPTTLEEGTRSTSCRRSAATSRSRRTGASSGSPASTPP